MKAPTYFDLGRTISEHVPHHPNHLPVSYRLTKAHGDVIYEDGISAANDMIVMGTHIGTHLDALGHIARHGRVWNDVDASDVQDRLSGFSEPYGIDSFGPLIWGCVVADVPRYLGLGSLAVDHLISEDELRAVLESQASPLEEGDALFIRTGWGSSWPNEPYNDSSPGPGLDAVLWAYDTGARLFGSDTLSFEHLPAPTLPVHRALLVERGVHILEGLDLEAIAAEAIHRCSVVVAPLKIRGGTSAPVRPIAIVQ